MNWSREHLLSLQHELTALDLPSTLHDDPSRLCVDTSPTTAVVRAEVRREYAAWAYVVELTDEDEGDWAPEVHVVARYSQPDRAAARIAAMVSSRRLSLGVDGHPAPIWIEP